MIRVSVIEIPASRQTGGHAARGIRSTSFVPGLATARRAALASLDGVRQAGGARTRPHRQARAAGLPGEPRRVELIALKDDDRSSAPPTDREDAELVFITSDAQLLRFAATSVARRAAPRLAWPAPGCPRAPPHLVRRHRPAVTGPSCHPARSPPNGRATTRAHGGHGRPPRRTDRRRAGGGAGPPPGGATRSWSRWPAVQAHCQARRRLVKVTPFAGTRQRAGRPGRPLQRFLKARTA